MMVVRGKIARFHLFFFFCFFLSFSTNLEIFFKFAKIVARTRANVNEDRRDPRNTLPFSQQPHVYHRIRDCLSDNYYYYYGCVSLTSFLHVYLSIFFFFYLDFHITFFFSLGSTILECSVFVWGSKTAARVDSRGSCSTACQQSGVRVIRKRHITLTT